MLARPKGSLFHPALVTMPSRRLVQPPVLDIARVTPGAALARDH